MARSVLGLLHIPEHSKLAQRDGDACKVWAGNAERKTTATWHAARREEATLALMSLRSCRVRAGATWTAARSEPAKREQTVPTRPGRVRPLSLTAMVMTAVLASVLSGCDGGSSGPAAD